MQIHNYPPRQEWETLMCRPTDDITTMFDYVRPVMADVKSRGDAALREYTMRFDGCRSEEIEVNLFELNEAAKHLDEDLKKAIDTARQNIEKFHAMQRQPDRGDRDDAGSEMQAKNRGNRKVGIYIPGGSAPLFSTVLMLAIPAKLAGCSEIIMCTPPSENGTVNPAILYAAQTVGITRIFKLGGIQAIAAMTYGTESVPAVYKIFGPGNKYVTAAKQFAALNNVAIDMPAGPSEVLVMADESANPEFVAADLLSQAEHGPDSQVILLTTSQRLLRETEKEVLKQTEELPRRDIALKALLHSRLILLKDLESMIDFSNAYAPEHLIMSVKDCNRVVEKITNAGSIFLGNYTPESAGDYASGTNHTLPTNGYARSYSGVNLMSFMKQITIQEITANGLQTLGPVIEKMAEAEQLTAHKNAVTLRLASLNR